MNVYRVKYAASITWRSHESFVIEVAAESEAQAQRLADERFDDEIEPDNWNAEVRDIDASVDLIELIAEGESIPVRCDKTLDIFEGMRHANFASH